MKNYKNLFEQIKQFKNKQEKQKQRGLNNYNILTTVLKEYDEVRLHSRMIASFLDPFGEHYQSNLFLDKFLEVLNISTFNIDSKNCSIYLEYQNIDLYITDGDKHIIIENKVYAKDQERQIERYIKIIKDKNQDLKPNDILVIYLSLDRDKPSKYSLGDLSVENSTLTVDTKEIALFKSIHYKNEILQWLEKCKYEVQNITNLNEVFRQYIDVVKMINNQYEDKIMSLVDYILKNKSIYNLAMEIKEELPNARKKSINIFFDNIVFFLKKELDDKWEIKLEKDFLDKKHQVFLRIYKKVWIVDNNCKDIIFGVIFDKEDYYDIRWGIIRNDNVDIKNIKKYSEELNELGCNSLGIDEWWLHLEYLNNTHEVMDFVEYIQFNEDAEKEFFNQIINLINIFENEDSKLMTEINSYLNKKDD